MKTPTCAVLVLFLFLSGCATSQRRVENHATDLEVLKLGVQALTEPREPAGTIKRAEDVENADQSFVLNMDLEETNWLQNQDKKRLRTFVTKAVDAIKESREPACAWWNAACKLRRRD